MSRTGEIDLPFPDEERRYRLKVGQLRELQEKCNKGPQEIIEDLSTGRWRVDDIIQPIRLGLVGAGMSLSDAVKFVDQHVHDGNFVQGILPAIAIIQAAISGSSQEILDLQKATGDPQGKSSAPTGSTASAPSTGPEPSSGSLQPKSMN